MLTFLVALLQRQGSVVDLQQGFHAKLTSHLCNFFNRLGAKLIIVDGPVEEGRLLPKQVMGAGADMVVQRFAEKEGFFIKPSGRRKGARVQAYPVVGKQFSNPETQPLIENDSWAYILATDALDQLFKRRGVVRCSHWQRDRMSVIVTITF